MEAPKTAGASEVVVGGQPVVVNRSDLEFTEEEKQRIELALAQNQEKNQIFVVAGERGQTKELKDDVLPANATIFFKDCHDGNYTVTSPTIKVLVERCTNFNLQLDGQVKTETLEVWRCENTHVKVNVPIKTLQADLSKKLSLTYKDKEIYGSVVWSGIYDFTLKVGDDVHESGFEQMKVQYPDINDQFDQFIVRYVNGALLSEQVVRLQNGFPTTEREAKEFDERQKAAEEAKEAYLRNLVKWAAPKLGIKDDRKRPKVGRNEPCPCKSGKKFKACCWNKYEN